jgi:hypothetical protein
VGQKLENYSRIDPINHIFYVLAPFLAVLAFVTDMLFFIIFV